jgi:hypothetical protein
MPATGSYEITPEAVLKLLSPDMESSCNVLVQVISLEEGSAQGGCKKVSLTISDGVHLLKCGVLPQLFHLIDSKAVSMYSIIQINQVVLSEICHRKMVLITDMHHVSQLDFVIGEPCFKSNDNKRTFASSFPDADRHPAKLICARDVKNQFQQYAKSDEEGIKDVVGVPCDSCNSNPCDWTTYGHEVISHLNDNYVGLYIDNDGNVQDELTESTSIITNRHLRYLAYCAFSAAKHGFLGKKKRIPLPPCVQMGIRSKFPDEHDDYVGFKYPKND